MELNNQFKFVRHNIFGSSVYKDQTGRFSLVKSSTNGKFYIQLGSTIPEWQGEGFEDVESAEKFMNLHEWNDATEENIPESKFKSDFDFLVMMYGFNPLPKGTIYMRELPQSFICLETTPDNYVQVRTPDDENTFNDLAQAAEHLDQLLARHDLEVFSCAAICNPSDSKTVVQAAISTRDLARNLVRVKSSNVWAYTINIRNHGDKEGDVLVQFKGPKGGPGDIYIYHDVPVLLWRRWLSAPSKGHFFWQYIRNVFQYRKLTGDKRGKLKNAVN